jgi:hypothetical protein
VYLISADFLKAKDKRPKALTNLVVRNIRQSETAKVYFDVVCEEGNAIEFHKNELTKPKAKTTKNTL